MSFKLYLIATAIIFSHITLAEPSNLTNIERVTVIGKASSERALLGGIN
jgi:hypothetical protein